MKKGLRTSELYVVGAVVLVWALRYLGIDIPLDQAQDTVADIAAQYQNGGAPDTFGAWVAAIYVAGRSLIKLKGEDKSKKND
jgi:hypothetical protein